MNPRPTSSLRGLLTAVAAVVCVGHGLAQNPDPPMSVIEFGSNWRFLDTNAVPPAQGGVASWKAVNYRADLPGSPWKSGFGLFGYGDGINYGQAISFGPNPNAKFITTYFWKSFVLPQGAAYTANASAPGLLFKSYEIGIMRDDAVAVYVNGTEKLLDPVAGTRDNLPNSPTAITHATLASGPLDGDSETSITTSTYGGSDLLGNGALNVICVEVHQSINTTPDMRFDLFLNLTDADPCYGAARPGIKLGFGTDGTEVGGLVKHIREPLAEPPFEDQDTEMNWQATFLTTAGTVGFDWVDGNQLPSTALSLYNGLAATLQWDSEPIDVRNFTNVVATAKVQAYKRAGTPAFSSGDKIDFTLRYSGDGTSYRDLPWQTISTSATATGTVWTDLVGENAEKKAIVPTTATDPLNVGANNWRTRGFSDAAWPTGTAGAGYENSPGDPTNYTSLIDGNFNFKSHLFDANPKKAVAYMRATFPEQPNRGTFTKLQLRVKYDDGFIAFINDVEVARKNVAATVTPANITPTTIASAGNGDTNAVLYEDIDITSRLTNIDMAQPNVLAVYALNSPAESSDMIVWPVLQIGKAGGPPAITLANIDDGDISTYTTVSTETAGPNGTSLIPLGTQAIKLRFRTTITATAAPNEGNKAFYFDDIAVTGTPIAADSYDTFIKVAAPAAAEADLDAKADLDGDSILNICEYAFVSNPTFPGLYTPDLRAGSAPGQMRPITPEVIFDTADAHVLVKFRVPSGRITGDASDGYEVLDLNIRPQMYDFLTGTWQDGASGVSRFAQFGLFEENNDGTVTVTCRSLDPVDKLQDKILFVRVRVGVTHPSYLSGPTAECPL